MSYVSSVGAYASAAAITPVRPNPDYAVAREAGKVAAPEPSTGFGPAAKVTLSPEAQAYLQSQKTGQTQAGDQKAEQAKAEQLKSDQQKAEQAKADETRKTEEAEARAKAEKAAAARKAYDAQRTQQDQTSPQG